MLKRTLKQISEGITKYIKADSTIIQQFLADRLTVEEIDELTNFGVRIDLLAYMTALGLEAKFIPKKLGIKEHRPEIVDKTIARKQVESVYHFLRKMEETALQKGIEFYSVLIPTSYSDSTAKNMYTRLGAGQDPLFVGTRIKQTSELKQLLIDNDMAVIDLRDVLEGETDTYLKFDTHWDIKGVELSSRYVSNYLIKNSSLISNSIISPNNFKNIE